MRAIGKGSLASILAMGLHFTRFFLVIAFVGLAIAMAVVPFVPFIVGLFSGFSHELKGPFGVGAGDYIEIAHNFVTIGVMLFVVTSLLDILKTLRFGSPFVRENADRFRNLGYALLIGEGAKLAFGFMTLFIDSSAEIHSSLITWLAIIAVFVLSEVFREGARMKEEQDLTV